MSPEAVVLPGQRRDLRLQDQTVHVRHDPISEAPDPDVVTASEVTQSGGWLTGSTGSSVVVTDDGTLDGGASGSAGPWACCTSSTAKDRTQHLIELIHEALSSKVPTRK
jgi:hypothetical protein